jgi:hypothetical protein
LKGSGSWSVGCWLHHEPMRFPLTILSISLAFSGIPAAATYHLDASRGDDSRSGLSPDQAWQSLAKFNATTFQPGDRILFKAGGVWNGQLKPKGSGRIEGDSSGLISISRYGEGTWPRIEGQGRFDDTVLLENIHGWEVADLEITNLGPTPAQWRNGVRVHATGIGKMSRIYLRRLYVHDVNGDLRKDKEGCGIFFEASSKGGAYFDGLLIEKCHVVKTDRNGICQRGHGGPPSRNVILRDNLLEDIGGDGIKLWGTNGGLIERNILRGGRMRCGKGEAAAGIWPFESNDTVIQFNQVSGMKGTQDGQAYDSDYNCRRTIFQYNYSFQNEGGFMLLCAPGKDVNEDTIVRYNVSVHDGINSARVFHFGGNATRNRIYNNTIVLSPQQNLPIFLGTDWKGGASRDTIFTNNLFLVSEGGRGTWNFGPTQGNVFESNLFIGKHEGLPAGIAITPKAPEFRGPLVPAKSITELVDFKPKSATGFPRGKVIPNNGGRDFFGKPVAPDKAPAIGAIEP